MTRLTPEAVASFLARTAVFGDSDAELLRKLGAHLVQADHEAGEPLVLQGEPGEALGFLVTGRATLRAPGDLVVEELEPGACFGETELLTGVSSPAMVIAEEDCTTVGLWKKHWDQVLLIAPELSQALGRIVARRCATALALCAGAHGAPEAAAAPAAARANGDVRFVEVAQFGMTGKVLELVPTALILEHRMLPLALNGKQLVVGMVNPFAQTSIQELRRVLHGVDAEVVAISADDFSQTLVRLKIEKPERAARGRPQPVTYHTDRRDVDKSQLVSGEEITTLLDRILLEGVDRGASDIHIEPEATGVRIRYRVQGMLLERKEIIPISSLTALVSRIKVVADLDITERRLPQDGRIGAVMGRRELNFRVSTLAASRGEKVVIRILDPTDVMRPLDQIFVDSRSREMVDRAIAAPFGAIIVAGPTGSGKSSSLYSMLNVRKSARPDNNIVTVEDPVEYLIPGITQVGVNPKAGLEFPVVLRALMRQDPDVVMIGELRDAATVRITVEAALTGHIVLTSLHASNAIAVFQRLEHLGADPVVLSQALNTIVVQRLARRLCMACAREDEIAPALLESLVSRGLADRGTAPKLPRPVGCMECDHTGFRGRLAVAETLALDEEVRTALAAGAGPADVLATATRTRHFVSFVDSARLLMARRLLAPADALLVVAA
jgi:type IV pilus assembly protein PilB